jgi:hypothetical protein
MVSTNLGDRKTNVIYYSSFVEQYNMCLNQILFYFWVSMHKNHCFKIKTINLDPDIFIQEGEASNKLTVPIIRTLTHRKHRENKRREIDSSEKFSTAQMK